MLGALFPPGVVTAETDLQSPHDELHPEEAELVAKAVPHRVAEFRAGRHCARLALRQLLGVEPGPLLRSDDRAPRWPQGVTGSLTHTGRTDRGYCAAAVAWTSQFRALGVDAELDSPLEAALERRVLVPDEVRFLETLSGDDRGHVAKLFFSAKECAYKAQYSLTRRFLEFAAMRVELTGPASFHATLNVDAGEFAAGHVFSGTYARSRGLIVTAVALRA